MRLTRLVIAGLFGLTVAWSAAAEPEQMSAPDVAAHLAGDGVLLDIRSREEWAETGVAEGAWPVSMHSPDFPAQLQRILSRYGPDRVAVICASGGRSSYVAGMLARNGIPGIRDVSEGMMGNGSAPGWIARGLPVVSSDRALAEFEAIRQSWE